MDIKSTSRGFQYIEFKDKYGAECSLQKSSSAGQDRIWFGANKIGLKKFCPGEKESWQDVSLNDADYVANNRMHLSQDQVKELLPFLQRFAETGNL